jgi:hypothetical protein
MGCIVSKKPEAASSKYAAKVGPDKIDPNDPLRNLKSRLPENYSWLPGSESDLQKLSIKELKKFLTEILKRTLVPGELIEKADFVAAVGEVDFEGILERYAEKESANTTSNANANDRGGSKSSGSASGASRASPRGSESGSPRMHGRGTSKMFTEGEFTSFNANATTSSSSGDATTTTTKPSSSSTAAANTKTTKPSPGDRRRLGEWEKKFDDPANDSTRTGISYWENRKSGEVLKNGETPPEWELVESRTSKGYWYWRNNYTGDTKLYDEMSADSSGSRYNTNSGSGGGSGGPGPANAGSGDVWLKVESRSKPGYFYWVNTITNETVWERKELYGMEKLKIPDAVTDAADSNTNNKDQSALLIDPNAIDASVVTLKPCFSSELNIKQLKDWMRMFQLPFTREKFTEKEEMVDYLFTRAGKHVVEALDYWRKIEGINSAEKGSSSPTAARTSSTGTSSSPTNRTMSFGRRASYSTRGLSTKRDISNEEKILLQALMLIIQKIESSAISWNGLLSQDLEDIDESPDKGYAKSHNSIEVREMITDDTDPKMRNAP